MGNNGLVDPKPGFSQASCFSRPAQCPASAPIEFNITVRYNRIQWQRAAWSRRLREVGCPRPVQAPASSVGAAPISVCWCHQRKCAVPEKARVKARRQKQSKTLKLEVRNSPRTWIKARSACQGPKLKPQRESKPKVLVLAGSWDASDAKLS